MALARVQATPKTNFANSATCVFNWFATPPTVGNAIVVIANVWRSGTQTVTGCTDNYGNAYTQVTQVNNLAPVSTIWYCPSLTATGANFEVRLHGTASNMYWVAVAIEISGVGTGLVVDQTATATGNAPTQPSTGVTAALAANDVLLAATFAIEQPQASIAVVSATPAWTQEFEELPFTHIAGEGDSRILTAGSGTTQSCSWTIPSLAKWASSIAAFKAPSTVFVPLTSARVNVMRLNAGRLNYLIEEVPLTPARVTQAVVEVLSLPVPSARVTQAVTETLVASPASDARVTQLAIETLSRVPETRVTQLVTETLTSIPEVGAARVTQLVTETLLHEAGPGVLLTQQAVEVFNARAAATRATQLAVETFQSRSAATRATQLAVEVFVPHPVYARTTQQAVEIYQARAAATAVTSVVVELFTSLPPAPPTVCLPEFPID